MAIEDNRIFNSNAEEIFLLQSMDGGGGSGGGFNGKYIAINSALNQVNGFNSLSIGKDNISATARTFTFGKNNLNLFENTLILGDKNKAVETKIYYSSYHQDNPYGDIGGKIINGKNNTLYNVNGASGIIINGENIEGGLSSLSVDVYVSAAGTEYHDYTYYYERVGMGQYERAYPTSSTYQDYYIKQENIIPLDDEHVYYGYFDTEGNYIFYKDTTFTEAWDLTEVDDTVILFDINTDTKVESIPYANIYYYYQGEYYNMPYASYLGSNVSNTIMNGSDIKNNVSPSGSIISGSNIRNNGNTYESLISGYNIENNNIYHGIIGGSNIQNNPGIGTSLVCGENIENLTSIQDSIITGRDIKGYSGYGENNGSVYYSALSGYGMKIYGASINYSSIGGNSHSIQGEVNYSLIHGSYLTLTGYNNYSIIGGYGHELKTTSYSLVSGYDNIINPECYFSIIGGNYNHLFKPSYSLISGSNHTIDGSYNIIGGADVKNEGSYNIIGGYGNQPNFGNYNIIAGYNNKSTSTINLNDCYKFDNETHKYIKIYNGSIATSLNNDDYVEYYNESDYSTKIYKVIDSDYTTPYDSTYFNAYLAVDWEYSDTYQPGDYVSRYYVYKCIAEATHIDPEEDTQHQYYIQITDEDTPYWEPTGTYEQGEYLQENPGWHDQHFYQAITNVPSGFELVNSVNNLSTNYNAIFGNNNTYQDGYNIVSGEDNVITKSYNAVFGQGLLANSDNQLVIGKYNIPENKAFIIGNGSDANHRSNIFTIDKSGKIGFGPGAGNFIVQTNGGRAITIDANSSENSILGGHNTITTSQENFIANFGHTVSNTRGSFISGSGNRITGGNAQTITGGGNFIEAGGCNFITNSGNKIKNGNNNTIEGGGNYLLGNSDCNHLEGGGNQVYGSQSHVEGGGNIGYSSINNTHIEGGGNKAYNGSNNHVEGAGCCIGGTSHSHVEGKYNISGIPYLKRNINTAESVPYIDAYDSSKTYEVGDYVTRPGASVSLDGNTYTPEELYVCTTAVTTPEAFDSEKWTLTSTNNALGCHAEGYETVSGAKGSHSEGYRTFATGEASHASGSNTYALGNNSFTTGSFTKAQGNNQAVMGKYNTPDSSSLLIIGNGTAENARSNALTLDASGNQVLAGKLTVGAAPTANMDVATKQYVDTSTSNLEGVVAAQYSATASYTANQDYVIYTDKLYLCNTNIAAGGEAWNASHWTEIKVADRLESIESDVSTLQTTVGDNNSGLVHSVNTLSTTVGDSSSGLVHDVTTLETTVGDANSGLVQGVSALNNTVNNANNGLVKRVTDLETNYAAFSLNRYSMTMWINISDTGDNDFEIYDADNGEELLSTDIVDVYINGKHIVNANYNFAQYYEISAGNNHDYKITFNNNLSQNDELEVYWQRLNGNTILPSQGVGF